MREYQRNYSDPESTDALLRYAEQVGLGSLFKKLGFLAERLNFSPNFVDACAKRLTTGYAHLDKRAAEEKLVTKWRLWVPKGYEH